MVYLSCDSIDKTEHGATIHESIFSPKFINGLKFSGVPNHRLALKVGVPIMSLRNIDQANGLCNGTRLQAKALDMEEGARRFPPQHQDEQPGIEYLMNPRPLFPLYSPILITGPLINSRGLEGYRLEALLIKHGVMGTSQEPKKFSKEGATIAFTYVRGVEEIDAKNTLEIINESKLESSGDPIAIPTDLRYDKNCKNVVDEVIDKYGCMDILVNLPAVIYYTHSYSLEEITEERLEKVFRTNVFSYFFLTRHALKHMKEGSSIVNTTGLALHLVQKRIRVNGVAPGTVWTPLLAAALNDTDIATYGSQVPLGAAQPFEIAPSFVFLASDESSYMTGQVLHPNGGVMVNVCEEDVCHIFFRCDLAQLVLRRICRWWGLDPHDWSSFQEWQSWILSIQFSSKQFTKVDGARQNLGWPHMMSIPELLMPKTSRFKLDADHKNQGIWTWYYNDDEYFIDGQDEIMFRVQNVKFPEIPKEQRAFLLQPKTCPCSHTIGQARRVRFRDKIYNNNSNIDATFAANLTKFRLIDTAGIQKRTVVASSGCTTEALLIMDPAVSTPVSGSGHVEDNNRIPDDLRCKRLDDTKGYMTPSSVADSSKSRSEKMHGAMTETSDGNSESANDTSGKVCHQYVLNGKALFDQARKIHLQSSDSSLDKVPFYLVELIEKTGGQDDKIDILKLSQAKLKVLPVRHRIVLKSFACIPLPEDELEASTQGGQNAVVDKRVKKVYLLLMLGT
ncbi:glucose and ribitol dehydrogenase-like protein [Tanacetum coccineum]